MHLTRLALSGLIAAVLMISAGCAEKKVLVQGRILVRFERDLNLAAAEATLDRFGLNYGGESCVRPNDLFALERTVVLEVGVPVGEEKLWTARLRKDPGIKDILPCYEAVFKN